jgi:hypothetical protein
MRIAGAVLGFVLLYAGAAVGWLGTAPGTCSMSNAQGLYAGVPALGLYLAGVGILLAARPLRWAYLALLPLAWPFLEQAALAIRLLPGLVAPGFSACGVLTGGHFEPTGEERFFLGLWLLVVVVPVLGLTAAFRRA